MATSGRPIPFSLREQIKQVRAHQSIRQTAKVLELSRNTVRKYDITLKDRRITKANRL